MGFFYGGIGVGLLVVPWCGYCVGFFGEVGGEV